MIKGGGKKRKTYGDNISMREVDEDIALPSDYAASSGNYVPT